MENRLVVHFLVSLTVDFPNSPTALRYLVAPGEDCSGVRLAEREDTSQPPVTPTEEDRSLYTAVVSPPTGQVTLRKGGWSHFLGPRGNGAGRT